MTAINQIMAHFKWLKTKKRSPKQTLRGKSLDSRNPKGHPLVKEHRVWETFMGTLNNLKNQVKTIKSQNCRCPKLILSNLVGKVKW